MNTLTSPRRFYGALAVICACVMTLQILQSRLFSVITWYHLSFFAISIAMFGLTLGALVIYKGNKADQKENLQRHLSKDCLSFGRWSIIGLGVQLCIPIVRASLTSVFITLPFVAAMSAVAYFYAGKIISLCLTRSHFPVGKIYAADMTGASLGCLFALFLMHVINAPSAVMITAGVIILTCILFGVEKPKTYVAIAAVLMGVGLLNGMSSKPFIYPLFTKGLNLAQNSIKFERWNAISRIIVTSDLPTIPIFLWGPSPKLPKDARMEYQYLTVDGAAGTPITKFDGKNLQPLHWLEYDVTNIAHFIPGTQTMAIVGAGGGRDVLSALYFGVHHVVALDINNIQIALLKTIPTFRSYTNLWNQPGIEIINSEARSWFTRHSEKYDMLQISLIDTWTSAGAGAFALTENGLYTVDAWKIFLSHLNDNGVMTVSRWHFKNNLNDLGRLASMTVMALLEMGEPDPWKNVYIAHAEDIATIVIGRHMLTDVQLDALDTASNRFGYAVLASPRIQKDDIINRILHAHSLAEIGYITADLPFDMMPPTDQRPFFFNQAHIFRPLAVLRQALSASMTQQNLSGHAVATANLYLILLLSILASAIVLVLPFRGALRHAPTVLVLAGSVYFALIGLGFLFVEISLMQIMSLFLGHPIYGLGIVLFCLVLSSGIGSFLSERFRIKTASALVLWTFVLAIYIALLSLIISPLLNIFIAVGLIGRVAICVGLIVPCGLLMGFAFPTGMRLAGHVSDSVTPWFWGINGAFGITASAVSLLISIGFGLNITLLAGALCYAMLCLPGLVLFRQAACAPERVG